jgi:prophage antirepressor-like protein/phage anti-repressor protein
MDKGTNKTGGISVRTKIPNRKGWVDARSLHQVLGVKRHFPTWIRDKIKHYGFIEGVDYQISFIPPNKPQGRMLIEYDISSDMAEKLAMKEQLKKNAVDSITSFNFEGHTLRVIVREGKLWFFVRDIILIFGTTYSYKVFRTLDNDDKATVITPVERSLIGTSRFKIISEYGLLNTLFRSMRATAEDNIRKKFINEALPKIRKAYAAHPSMLDRFRQFIKSLRKQPEILPLCDRPGFPINLPAKEAQNEWA